MFSFKKPLLVCTHNGQFHADDVFACALLSLWAEKNKKDIKIVRTRDEQIIHKADIVIDVGGSYNERLNLFDHHQEGFDLKRENGIPYASFGLVWKKYAKSLGLDEEVIKMVEKKLVVPIDAHDNGINLIKNIYEDISEYTFSRDVINLFRINWDEDSKNIEKNFNEVLVLTLKIIKREIEISKSVIKGENLVLDYIEKQREPDILILDKYLPWERVVGDFRKIYTVVCPDFTGNNWCAEVTRSDITDYLSNKADFPLEWAGKSGDELVRVSGVKDAIFCHKGLFFASAKTKEGAIELARKAIKKV